ncbi:MAG: chemotaxis protein CheW [Proteobacteria bacterium]|nr:chemotaxis protein CheW [Pseudomonadota bacterium]
MTDDREDVDKQDIDKQVLTRRAKELAMPVEQHEQIERSLALLEFRLMGMRYAVYLEKVEAVSRIGDIVSIPMTPPHISGIIRRRGQSIALISLRHFFHPNTEGIADADFAVIVTAQEKRFALQVEEIQGVIHLMGERTMPPPDNFDSAQAPFISGVTTDGLSVIDLESLVDANGFSLDSPVM